jgi:putative restriction endonuclease
MQMRYWWVNQNQTLRQEVEGGYLWSPKRNKNGHRNPFYEFMREVSPGDIVFSSTYSWFMSVSGQGARRILQPQPSVFHRRFVGDAAWQRPPMEDQALFRAALPGG